MQKPPKPETEPSEGTRRIPRQDPGRCHGHPTGRRASACSHAARVRGGGGGLGSVVYDHLHRFSLLFITEI